MKKLILAAAVVAALAVAGTAAAALTPWTFDPGNTGCVTSGYSNGTLQLAKNCPTSTDASAGASLTGLGGQTFASSSFTLASASQCQGGSPRFNIVTSNGSSETTYFLGCNNVAPTINPDGSATYTFDTATLAAAGNQVPFPSGTIDSASVLIDVQGVADLTNILVNGQPEVPAAPTKAQCKRGGWRAFDSPSFKNQGQCVSYAAHHSQHGHNGHHGH